MRILAKAKTLAAFAYKKSVGQPFVYPRNDLSWPANFLHMMFAVPAEEYEVNPVIEDALNMLLILHADHEQNCSTSTDAHGRLERRQPVRVALRPAICGLWGPLHGGANQEVIEMLEAIQADGGNVTKFLDR